MIATLSIPSSLTLETHSFILLEPSSRLADDVFQADESAAHNEEDFFRIDADVFLLRVLAASGGRNIADGAFNDFQQSLLHAFPGDVPRNGDILCFASDFVDFIQIGRASCRERV